MILQFNGNFNVILGIDFISAYLPFTQYHDFLYFTFGDKSIKVEKIRDAYKVASKEFLQYHEKGVKMKKDEAYRKKKESQKQF